MSVDDAQLFLVGFMGSGKSTVALQLAKRSGRPCVDLDAEIETRSGSSIAELFSAGSEARFRRIESEVLREVAGAGRCIVATGGGTYVAAANRRTMRRSGVTVWLDVPLGEALARTPGGTGRPLWQDRDPIAFRAFFERRRTIYALADLRVPASQKTPETVAIDVFERFERFFD